MFSLRSKHRLMLGLLGVFLLINCTYSIALNLYAPSALPVTIGLATVLLIYLSRRWHVTPPVYDRELQQLAAMINLAPMLRGTFLPFGPWAMEPVHLLNLLARLQSMEVNVIVECGAGTSTLLIGNSLRQKGQGHVYSLEEDLKWYNFMSLQIEAQDLSRYVTVVHAPLEPYPVDPVDVVGWYSISQVTAALSGVDHIDLLIIDGPKSENALSRFPALPVFLSRSDSKTLIVLDDVNRPQEQLVLSKWQELCSMEIDLHQEANRHQAYVRVRDFHMP